MIDKKGKLFDKVSVIDLFALLVIILAAVFLSRGMGVKSIVTPQSAETAYISFQTEQAADCVVPCLVPGARVMDEARGVALGNIIGTRIAEGYDYNPDEYGNLVVSPKYGYSYVEITSEVKGVMNERGLWVDGNRYIVGHSMSVIAGDAILYMRVSGIEAKP